MNFYLFQAEYGNLLTGVAVAIVTGVSTYLIVRGKNTGDVTKSLTESCEILVRQVKAAYEEMPIFRTKIQELEALNTEVHKDADHWKEIAIALEATIIAIQSDADLVVQEIDNLAFITTGEPTEADTMAIKRLKNMRDAAKRMKELKKG